MPPTPIMLVAGVYGGLIAVVGKAVGTIVFDDESRDYDLEIDDEYNEFVNWRLNYLCNLIGVKSHRDRFAVLNYLITGNFDQLWIE